MVIVFVFFEDEGHVRMDPYHDGTPHGDDHKERIDRLGARTKTKSDSSAEGRKGGGGREEEMEDRMRSRRRKEVVSPGSRV